MRIPPVPQVCFGLLCVCLTLIVACGNPTLSTTALKVSVTGAAAVALGSTSQYAANVAGSGNQAVTWSVNRAPGGNAEAGTISNGGLYSAPAAMPSSGTVIIAAVSAADSSISGIISVALQADGVKVSVTGAAAVALGSTSQYAANVAGSGNQAVNWSVN